MKEKDLTIMEQFRKCIPIFSVLNDAKRQEIYDKDIHHYYIDEQDAYVSNTLQVKDKCGRQEEVEVGGHLYASNILTVALDEIADYSEQCGKVTDGLLSRIDAAQTAGEVEAIVVEGYPEMIHTTTAALQTKADKAIAKSPEAQAVTFARTMMNSVSLTASQALEMQVLFPIWGEKDAEFGKEVEIGFRLRVVEGESDTLFEVIQKHKLQADWEPGIEAEMDAILEKYDPFHVAVFYCLRPYQNRWDQFSKAGQDSKMAHLIAERAQYKTLRGTLTSVEQVDSLWKADFPSLPSWRSYKHPANGWPDGMLKQIAEETNMVRDVNMCRAIIELVNKGERVFISMGASHAPRIEGTLRGMIQ